MCIYIYVVVVVVKYVVYCVFFFSMMIPMMKIFEGLKPPTSTVLVDCPLIELRSTTPAVLAPLRRVRRATNWRPHLSDFMLTHAENVWQSIIWINCAIMCYLFSMKSWGICGISSLGLKTFKHCACVNDFDVFRLYWSLISQWLLWFEAGGTMTFCRWTDLWPSKAGEVQGVSNIWQLHSIFSFRS